MPAMDETKRLRLVFTVRPTFLRNAGGPAEDVKFEPGRGFMRERLAFQPRLRTAAFLSPSDWRVAPERRPACGVCLRFDVGRLRRGWRRRVNACGTLAGTTALTDIIGDANLNAHAARNANVGADGTSVAALPRERGVRA